MTILELPKSYVCITACSGEPNSKAFHGLHVDRYGLTCTDGKCLAHVAWMPEEVEAYKLNALLPEEGKTISIQAGLVVHGGRARIDLSKPCEGEFPPYRTVLPNLENGYTQWAPDVKPLDLLDTVTKLGRVLNRQQGIRFAVYEGGLAARMRDPDAGEIEFSYAARGTVLLEPIGFRADVLAKVVAAANRDVQVLWPESVKRPTVLVAGRLLVLAMSCELVGE